jgi:hypothetical protein
MSRAEYYREYRRRRKVATVAQQPQQIASSSAGTDLANDFILSLAGLREVCNMLHNVAQQMQQSAQQMQQSVQQLQHVAQQVQQSVQQLCNSCATLDDKINSINCKDLGQDASDIVAQQSQQNVAQHVEPEKKPKRKGSSPPSSPPSLPPQTPPYSPPLLSPPSPKEKPRENFAISSGEVAKVELDHNPAFPDIEDNPDAPLVDPGKAKGRDLATWRELEQAAAEIWEETRSHRLQDAFYSWVEYKQERGAKEFYTRKGMIAAGKHFIRRHLDEFDVHSAVQRAIASNWQGWDHELKR